MEIIIIPLSGAVEHQDNTGVHSITLVRSAQLMSARSYVAHLEFNASKTEALTLFQIWIETRDIGILLITIKSLLIRFKKRKTGNSLFRTMDTTTRL